MKKDLWLFGVFFGDEILRSYVEIMLWTHEIRIPIIIKLPFNLVFFRGSCFPSEDWNSKWRLKETHEIDESCYQVLGKL